jgi:hypothetical protein
MLWVGLRWLAGSSGSTSHACAQIESYLIQTDRGELLRPRIEPRLIIVLAPPTNSSSRITRPSWGMLRNPRASVSVWNARILRLLP